MRTYATRLLMIAAVSLIPILPISAGDVRVETPTGPVIISVNDNDITLAIQQAGKRVVIEDTISGKKVVLVEGCMEQKIGNDVTLAVRQIAMKRGDKVVAEVRPDASASPGCVPVGPAWAPGSRPQNFVPALDCPPTTGTPDLYHPPYGPSVDEPAAAKTEFPRLKETVEPPEFIVPNTDSDDALLNIATSLEAAKDYTKAVMALKGFVRRYPNSTKSTEVQMKLGLAFWNLARGEDARKSAESANKSEEAAARQRNYLASSRDAYDSVEQSLLARLVNGQTLSDTDASYLKKAAFWGADCCFWMREYGEAKRRYIGLAIRYRDRPEELIALSQEWQCLVFLRSQEQAKGILSQIKTRLSAIKFDSTDAALPTNKREFWEKWIQATEEPEQRSGAQSY